MAQGTKGTSRRPEPTDETLGLRPPVSLTEAAAMLGLSRWTVYRMVGDGRLRAVKIGGRQKIRRIEIDRYIERQQREADKYAS